MRVLGGFCFSFLEGLWRAQWCLLTPAFYQESRKCPRQLQDGLMLLLCFLLMGANSDPHFTCKDIALKGVLFLSL